MNLAGRLVDARPTPAAIADLRASRVDATRALVQASHEAATPVAHWLQASTTAIWSDAGQRLVDETTPLPTGSDALPQMTGVAHPWEAAVEGANTEHLTILRTSIVLALDSPAFDRLALLARAGLGGTVGDGRQWFSWIHLTDWLAVARAALGLGPVEIDGVVNATAPHPVTNAELMAALRQRLHPVGVGLPTPKALVRLGSRLLDTDPALALTGRRVLPAALLRPGFDFVHPTLAGALDDLLT